MNDFLTYFQDIKIPDLREGGVIDFSKPKEAVQSRFIPNLRLAKPEDAIVITEIFKEVYSGTYPYKDLEDIDNLADLIKRGNYLFVLFVDSMDNIAAFFMVRIDLKKKRGYLGGLAIRLQYRRTMDLMWPAIVSLLFIYRVFQDSIFLWYGETRTAHSKSQYITSLIGAKPIGFFPNKDIFLNKVESDLMQILYNKRTLTDLRYKRPSVIIPEVFNCFSYSNKRYDLGLLEINYPDIKIKRNLFQQLKKEFQLKRDLQKFGYERITFSFTNSTSFFTFLYTHQLKNIEKTSYEVNNFEELSVFLKQLSKFMQDHSIRYFECFVSAYKPCHQKIFYKSGCRPRGYIPSWNYNEDKGVFEDCILFNSYRGEISDEIKLIPEGIRLLKALGFR